MRWPWISREWHREVVDAHKRLEDTLREEIAGLRARIDKPVAVTVELPKDFAVIQQAIVAAPPKGKKGKKGNLLSNIDYAEVDENDQVQMSTLLMYHLGDRAKSANIYEKRQVLHNIVVKIRAAKEARLRERAVAVEDSALQDAPQHIKDQIGAAERGE